MSHRDFSTSSPSQFDQKKNTNSVDKHCELSHFDKLDVSYASAIQHTFSKWSQVTACAKENDETIYSKIKNS